MKRSLLVVTLVVLCAAPSFAWLCDDDVNVVRLPDFGYGICVSDYGVLLGIAGDDIPGSLAEARANAIARRLNAGWACGVPLSQIYVCKDCGSGDYKIVVERCIGDALVAQELVTVDTRTAKPYGASAKQLADFWAKRIKWCLLLEMGVTDMPCTMVPKDIMKAGAANWRCWKGCGTITCPCE